MGMFTKRPGFTRRATDANQNDDPITLNTVQNANKDPATVSPEEGSRSKIDEEQFVPSNDVQTGIKEMEAVTLTWTKKSLVLVLVLIWFIYLVNAFMLSILYDLTPFATSSFGSHSLLTVIEVVSNSMTAAVFIPLAKMLDLWGRAEGFVVMVLFSVLGMILMASSHNIETYSAAQVFFSVGTSGLIYSIDVVTADSTSLRNRALAYAFTSSPYIIVAFAGPKASEGFQNHVNWRWGFGAFSIILPAIALPLYTTLKINLRKAKKDGVVQKTSSGRSVWSNVWWFISEFDLIGVFLFASGLVVFLLPFNIAANAPNGWATGYIIAMIVVGFIVLVGFAFWELVFAPMPFLKFSFLTDRTLVGACLLDLTYQISYYCWNYYFSSFLIVVNYLSISEAGYIAHTFDVVSGVLLFIVGWSIRKTGYFKWLLWVGLPIYILGQGLMIHFRRPDAYVGYIVMCQIFIAVGGSVFIMCMQLAVLAAVDHQYVAAALAMLNVAGTVGGSVGPAISGAIWTNTFPSSLKRFLPSNSEMWEVIDSVIDDIEMQMSYPKGSVEREALQKAYSYAQTRMLAAGTSILALGFIWVAMIRNLNVKNMKQTKGNVF